MSLTSLFNLCSIECTEEPQLIYSASDGFILRSHSLFAVVVASSAAPEAAVGMRQGALGPPTKVLSRREGWKLLLMSSRHLCWFDVKPQRIWISGILPVFLW